MTPWKRGDEEETEKVVSQVIDEIGVSFDEEIPVGPALATGTEVSSSAPQKLSIGATGGTGGTHSGHVGGNGGDSTLNDLEARLNNLNNGN